MIVLPDVRGLFGYYEELALRFAAAEIGIDAIVIDYYGRTAGASRRDAGFDYMPHTEQTTWVGLRADIVASAEELRASSDISSLFTIGFCFGGRTSFLSATIPDLRLAGVIGFHGCLWVPHATTRRLRPISRHPSARPSRGIRCRLRPSPMC